MPGTYLAEVSTAQLVGGAASSLTLTPQATDPAANASAAQIYEKTDKQLYHQDVTGTVSNLLLAGQIANNALGNNTVAWPYGSFNMTGPGLLNSGASQNTQKGIVAHASGSIVGAFIVGNAATALTGNMLVYKNGVSFFTALTGVVMQTSQGLGVPKYATFQNGAYSFAPGDALDCYVSISGSGLYIGAGLILNFGNVTASAVSSSLTANATVGLADNQRVWVANAATAYTLTLPATNPSQDFYVRVFMTAGAGVTVQAPSGVQIYLGTTLSQAAGNISTSAVGSSVVLYNPAGTSLWLANSVTGNWSVT